MSKILVNPKTLESIKDLIVNDVDGFILGVEDFSLFSSINLNLEELKIFVQEIKLKQKEVFILLNKIIYNQDIPLLKEYLLVIDKFDVDGIIYDDLSLVNLKRELDLKTPLVWSQMHLVTNYYTCNYWLEKGVSYAIISNEITLDEIREIKQNTKMRLMVNAYGYLPMFQSSRKLLSNYFEYINEANAKDNCFIYEETRKQAYPIYEDKNGSYILSNGILNTLKELTIFIDSKIDYIILNSLFIDEEKFLKVVSKFKEARDNINNQDIIDSLSNDIDNINGSLNDKGFLYKETIYRVKNNE